MIFLALIKLFVISCLMESFITDILMIYKGFIFMVISPVGSFE